MAFSPFPFVIVSQNQMTPSVSPGFGASTFFIQIVFNKIGLNKICHRKDFLTTHFHPKNPRHPDIKPQESPRVSSFYLLQDTPDKRSLRHLVS